MRPKVGKVGCEITRNARATFLRCTRCGHHTAGEGTDDRALRAAYARMRKECPGGVRAFYVSSVVAPERAKGKWTFEK